MKLTLTAHDSTTLLTEIISCSFRPGLGFEASAITLESSDVTLTVTGPASLRLAQAFAPSFLPEALKCA